MTYNKWNLYIVLSSIVEKNCPFILKNNTLNVTFVREYILKKNLNILERMVEDRMAWENLAIYKCFILSLVISISNAKYINYQIVCTWCNKNPDFINQTKLNGNHRVSIKPLIPEMNAE